MYKIVFKKVENIGYFPIHILGNHCKNNFINRPQDERFFDCDSAIRFFIESADERAEKAYFRKRSSSMSLLLTQ